MYKTPAAPPLPPPRPHHRRLEAFALHAILLDEPLHHLPAVLPLHGLTRSMAGMGFVAASRLKIRAARLFQGCPPPKKKLGGFPFGLPVMPPKRGIPSKTTHPNGVSAKNI